MIKTVTQTDKRLLCARAVHMCWLRGLLLVACLAGGDAYVVPTSQHVLQLAAAAQLPPLPVLRLPLLPCPVIIKMRLISA